ncbi:MAG: YifB family Mg chelatase-like AAA ATPase [Candidatus Wildermuthbacteria bacterium]|nr:YifB family Mg chelatase-like AAA ATPase [Candidatus Wildermuthbacteria bacterium]
MLSKVYSAALVGIDAHSIEVETDVSYGLRFFEIVGLADKSIEESKERIAVALKRAKFKAPHSKAFRVLVSLAPADLKKEGALYDLPIAVGFLISSTQLSCNPARIMLIGELSLDGKLRPVQGAFACALLAKQLGYKELILPRQNAEEASLSLSDGDSLAVLGADTLLQVVSHLKGQTAIPPHPRQTQINGAQTDPSLSLSLIHGQQYAKRALALAAAGSHNILLQGPPGTGKTLLAKALSLLLPPLSREEALEATRVHSAAGLLNPNNPFISRAPFRSPHHTSSEAALIGGGNPVRPGEITLAHKGVLFLDEFPEFHRDVLESLRQPMEDGTITLLRAKHRLSLPASFMLIAAANPCPCGYYRSPDHRCVCSPSSVQKYRRKLSGPLMDRMDMLITVPQIKFDEIAPVGEQSLKEEQTLKDNVLNAREMQWERLGTGRTNSVMTLAEIQRHCEIGGESKEFMKKYVDSGKLSIRGYHRVLKVARTIADMEQSERIAFPHLTEAVAYRVQEE